MEVADIGKGSYCTRCCCAGSFERWPRRLPSLGVLSMLGWIGISVNDYWRSSAYWKFAGGGLCLVSLVLLLGWCCRCPVPTGAKRTRLLARWPWLPPVMWSAGMLGWLTLWGGLLYYISKGPSADICNSSGYRGICPMAVFLIVVLLTVLVILGKELRKHQHKRQLHRSPVLG
eukprot:COSAG06_NODE_31735_length_516_cov_1.352518_1_plen_172_part_11